MKIRKTISNYFNNQTARLIISLFGGMIINSFYIAGNLASALLHGNVWSATLTVYHALFLVIRFYLITAKRRCKTDLSIRRACLRVGIILLFLDLAATVIMIYTVRQGRVNYYSGVVLLCFVIYTAYSLVVSIMGMKKHSNDNQHLHFAARNMTFASALMSVFNLQYSRLFTMGASSSLIDRMVAFSGFSIFFAIILLAVRLVKKNASACSKF